MISLLEVLNIFIVAVASDDKAVAWVIILHCVDGRLCHAWTNTFGNIKCNIWPLQGLAWSNVAKYKDYIWNIEYENVFI